MTVEIRQEMAADSMSKGQKLASYSVILKIPTFFNIGIRLPSLISVS